MDIIKFFRVMLGLVSLTLVQVATIVLWLVLVLAEPPLLSVLPENAPSITVIAAAVLLVGLFLEAYLNEVTLNGISVQTPVIGLGLYSITKAGIWFGWFHIAETVDGRYGVALAGVFLAAILVVQYTIEDNVLRGRGLFSKIVARGTVGASLFTALGATAALAFAMHADALVARLPGRILARIPTVLVTYPEVVGLAALGLFLFVATVFRLQFGLREETEPEVQTGTVLDSIGSP
jgi:hypothetical protein